MAAPITQGVDRLLTLSQHCQEKVNSVVDQMDGFRQELQSSQVVSRDFVTHQALQAQLGAVTKSAAEGHKIAEKVVGEVDGLRQDFKKMKDVNLEAMQQHPDIAGLQASEERELQAYGQVLLRLDELAERLQTFEKAFAGIPTFDTAGRGIPAEYADRYGSLVDRVAEYNALERQLEANFHTHTVKSLSLVAQEAPAGDNIIQRELE